MASFILSVYNECHVEILVSCRYVDDGGREREIMKAVPPGDCELMCRAAEPRAALSAATQEGEYIWEEKSVELCGPEHTHVVSCACDPHTHDCPQVWLSPPSRQLPESGKHLQL